MESKIRDFDSCAYFSSPRDKLQDIIWSYYIYKKYLYYIQNRIKLNNKFLIFQGTFGIKPVFPVLVIFFKYEIWVSFNILDMELAV